MPKSPVIVPVSIPAIERRPVDHNRRRRRKIPRPTNTHTNNKALSLSSRSGCQRCTSQCYNGKCLHNVGLHRCELHNVASCLALTTCRAYR